MSADRRHRQYLLPLTKRIRRDSDRSGEASEGAGEAKRPTKEPGDRGGTGQGHSAGSRVGKLLSPLKRRRTVEHVRVTPGHDRVSERRACQVLGQSRSIQRRQSHAPEDELRLVHRMTEPATPCGRYVYRRITTLLRRKGWIVNRRQIERL